MSRRKRNATEAELDVNLATSDAPVASPQPEILTTIRNMWEFASLMQWIFMFGHIVKIDEDFDVEDLEHECLQPNSSPRLASIGLAMLKLVSSHRGLTPEIFSEYTRRQYLAKAPARNPFGDEDEPTPFNDLDILTRLQVLQQLSTWTFTNAERVRGMMGADEDDMNWRIEPLGWDADDTAYFVLDDNRLYSRTDEAPPSSPAPKKNKAKAKPAPKKKRKVAKALPPPTRGTRTSSRLKVADESEPDDDDENMEDENEAEDEDNEHDGTNGVLPADHEESGFGFTAKTWKCVAITLPEYQIFLESIKKTRDPNEKTLRRRIEEEVLPIIEKRAEALRQKQLKKLRELENIQKMATAKRSSRIADKAEKQAKEDGERREEEKKLADLRMAREEQLKQKRIEEGHESRRLTREQRLKDREVKRILHEEELARLEREGSAADSQDPIEAGLTDRKRSSRNIQNQKEMLQKELEQLRHDQSEDAWYFDCVVCGMHGDNLDDGSHSVACERCSVWQHSACHGFTPEQCEKDDFHFICSTCRRKEREEQEQKEQRSGFVLKLGKRSEQQDSDTIAVKPRTEAQVKQEAKLPDFVQQQLNQMAQGQQQPQLERNFNFIPQNHAYQRPKQKPVTDNMHIPPPHSLHTQSAQYPSASASGPPGLGTSASHMTQHNQSHQRAINGYAGHAGHVAHPPSQFVQYTPPPRQVSTSTQNGQHQVSPPRVQLQPAPVSSTQNHTYQTFGAQNNTTQPLQPTQQPPMSRPPSNDGHIQPPHISSSPPQHRHPVEHTPRPYASASPHRIDGTDQRPTALPSSPGTSLLPPKPDYNRQAAISPIKSSPPRAQAQPSPHMQNTVNGQAHSKEPAKPVMSQTANTPNGSFEHVPKLETPSKAGEVAVAPTNYVTKVAEHGMQGPWPTRVLDVPTKNDTPAQQP